MSLEDITDIEQLRKINNALLNRVESAMDQQGNAFSLFQTAINLEGQVKRRTDELTAALRNIETTNTELENAKEASDKANLSKTKFLAAASHDILQPLNAALLSISVLADLQNTELGKNLAAQIERSLDTMSELIESLIDISKLDAGVATPRYEVFTLTQLIENIESDFSTIAAEKNLEFRLLGNPDVTICSDRTMLRRILQNLVSNALRYTTHGGVLLGLRQREGITRIEVVDTGCGIPKSQHENIFEEFNRGALPRGHQREANQGLGLGLSIVRRMTRTLGHNLEMRSIVDRGTRFILDVPNCDIEDRQPISNPIAGKLRLNTAFEKKRVLLVENDPASITSMLLLLESWNCEARVGSTIIEISRILSDTDWLPDIIIADQHLDHGDLGTEAIVMAREYLGKDIPSLLITADPTKALEQKVKVMGLELMKKPVKPAQLRALLAHLVTGHMQT
jgi:signal transduction histidine kinase